ncbi:MAG: DUF6438 domain-containing protein [Bacteroidia bacterium]
MKTLKHFNLKNILSASAIASVLFFASCEKEIIQAPSGINAKGDIQKVSASVQDQQASSLVSNKAPVVIDMIKIDHQAALTHTPDYSVTVKSNGLVIYEGRKYVAVTGQKKWILDSEKFAFLKSLYSDFDKIQDNLSLMADVPMVYTTWSASADTRTIILFDYDLGEPEQLINLRKRTELLLDIDRFIGHLVIEHTGTDNNK